MNPPLWLAFIATSVVLAVTPGPGVVYVVTRTAAQGRRAGLASVAGVALGNLCNAVGASLGLAALFAASSTAFAVVKLAGAAYLVYLGVRALRQAPADSPEPSPSAPRLAVILRESVAVALLNPKTALFFAALLPQFIDPAGSAAFQAVGLAAVFVGIAAVTDSAYVFAASAARVRLARSRTAQRLGTYATAATFVGLGVFAAASGSQAPR